MMRLNAFVMNLRDNGNWMTPHVVRVILRSTHNHPAQIPVRDMNKCPHTSFPVENGTA
jgi:hypothetical protein